MVEQSDERDSDIGMQTRWASLWRAVASSEPRVPFDQLCTDYGEADRAYHTLEHVRHCLAQLDAFRDDHRTGELEHPTEVELALWLHDVVYRPREAHNEQRSADWAARYLRAGSAHDDTVERVSALILATRHDCEPDSPDAALVVDIDLSILGAAPDAFDGYEAAIGREYSWVPISVYREKRAAFLEAFLARPSLYGTEYFRARYELTARENLQRSLRALQTP